MTITRPPLGFAALALPVGCLAALALGFAACGGPADPPDVPARDAGPAVGVEEPRNGPSCADRIAALAPVPPDPALTHYQRELLPQIVLGAKIEPVLFLRRPARDADPVARELAAQLAADRWPARRVRKLLKQQRSDKPLLRKVFLSRGYLYEERPEVARALVKELTLAALFDEPRLYLHRDGRALELVREDDEYLDAEGERIGLLLNDRIALEPDALRAPLHLDLDEVRDTTGAARITPLVVGERAAAVRLRYPSGTEADALIEQDGLETAVVCVDLPLRQAQAAAQGAEQLWSWSRAVSGAAARMVSERQLFDEPVDEAEGEQEDGQLRIEWRKAYFRGQRRFAYREEKYRVYDWRGNPTPPQVCIDFIFDTLERASGNWFKGRRSRPGRTAGFLDFSILEGFLRRQTPAVLAYASDPATPLLRYDIPDEDRVPFRQREQFTAALARHADEIVEGDVLVVHGLREEDRARHYHTLLVLRTEPLTGLPMVVADNAGRPRIRTVSSAMRSAPRRSIKHRLRIEPDWLSQRQAAIRAAVTPAP